MKALLIAGLLLLAAPAAAQADSIVYIDQGNVWSARPDGGAKVQLTTGGGWHSPTQADDGTVAAVQGTGPIVVMARDGRRLRTIATPEARSGDGGTFASRPVELSFSPDGTKIAYAYVASSCPVASTCGTIQRSTFYTSATGETPVSTYGNQFGVSDPEWVTDSRTLVFGGHGSQVSIDDLGPGDYSQKPWMTPDFDMGDGEVTRDGRRLAVTYDYGADKKLAFFAVKGDVKTETPPAYPDAACSTTDGDAQYADPSWSPDGSGVAFQSSSGIEVARFSAFGADLCTLSGSSVLTATGSEPDWGPADPPAAASTPPAPLPAPTPSPAPAPAPHVVAVSLEVGPVTTKALRRGLAIQVTAPAGAKIGAHLLRGRHVIARATASGKGAARVTLHLSRVRHVTGHTLTLKLTVGGSVAEVRRLTLHR
jgi:WD40-like Beta Propeller Repeat